MFNGTVNIIKRRNRLHCGIKYRMGSGIKLASACNRVWDMSDITYEADAKEVTCKTCLKILSKADESGRVNLGRQSGGY